MTSTAKLAPRERLLRAAADLFYREGITATGVDKLCQAAGISKKSMYQFFATKDELLTESLTACGPASVAGYFADPAADLTPRERILHVFEHLEKLAAGPDFFGCPFVSAAAELRDPTHPASLVAGRFKQLMTDYFEAHARLAGAADPETLAKQLTIVYDGAAARSVVRATGLDGLSLLTASALLAAAGIHPAGRESDR
ncbi:TetR/AcrR family transcriptional regulator [Micromonospora sp. NPDC004704]